MKLLLCSALLVVASGQQLETLAVTADVSMPAFLENCIAQYANQSFAAEAAYTTVDEIQMQCLRDFIWQPDLVNWKEFNITEKDMDYVNSLAFTATGGRTRTKREAKKNIFPQSGFRIRREYRRLSDGERFAFHAALNKMKKSGQYDMFANIHQGIVVKSAHFGVNFLGWHRIYIALFEEALRRYDKTVSLPYWDSSLDFNLKEPAYSIIWSPAFMGNGDGFVVTGPFAKWQAGKKVPLTRNIAGDSTLISRQNIAAILSRCRTTEIVSPWAKPKFDFELAHAGIHGWVGGHMFGMNTAAADPIFFLHHAFIDYIWELFRQRQASFCKINPETDYPPSKGLHGPKRPMDGLPGYRNIDGFRSFWTQFWYNYEPSPTCSKKVPSCGTPYLQCEPISGVCFPVTRKISPDEAKPYALSPRANRGRAQALSINIGPTFRVPPPDPRTQAALLPGVKG